MTSGDVDFASTLRPYGSVYVTQLYSIIELHRLDSFKSSIMEVLSHRGTFYNITGDGWPVLVYLFERQYIDLPDNIGILLLEDLISFQTEAFCRWHMFEGAFDITNLDSDWSCLSTYSIAPKSTYPTLAMLEYQRSNQDWLSEIKSCFGIVYEKVTTQREKLGIRMLPLKILTKPCQTFRPCFLRVEGCVALSGVTAC